MKVIPGLFSLVAIKECRTLALLDFMGRYDSGGGAIQPLGRTIIEKDLLAGCPKTLAGRGAVSDLTRRSAELESQ